MSSAKRLGILRSFMDLSKSPLDLTALVQSNSKFFSDSLFDTDIAVASLAVELLAALSSTPRYRACLCAAGVPASLAEVMQDLPPASREAAAAAIAQLRIGSAAASAGSGAAAAAAPPATAPRKEVRGVQLNMDGLLGRKEQEDQYIKALLLIDGITSVTIDRVRAVAIAYTQEEREMKGQLYDVVQGVCDRLRDAAGLRRIVVKKNDHATYLEEEESEEEGEDEDDFFSQKLVVHAAGKPAAARSAEERLRGGSGNAAAAAAPASILGGAIGWIGSSFGW